MIVFFRGYICHCAKCRTCEYVPRLARVQLKQATSDGHTFGGRNKSEARRFEADDASTDPSLRDQFRFIYKKKVGHALHEL